MKRKLFATLGLVVASMMVFAGCGGSGDATTSPSADANAASGSKLMVIGSTSVEPLMQKFIDTYTEAQVEMQAPGSSQGIAAAQDGTADIGMAGMTITADKEENVQFSTPYYNASQQIAVLESNTDFDNCKTREDIAEVLRGLEGKKIQAAAGYTGYDYAEQFTNLKLTAQEDIGTSVRELSNGRTDIVVGDKYTINEMVKALNADLS